MLRTPVIIIGLSVAMWLSVAWLAWESYVTQPTPQSTQAAPTRAAKDPMLFATGDVASCTNTFDEATAQLVSGSDAPIALLGDNVYQHGTAEEFEKCFAPAWGQWKDRIHPAAGNHEYETGQAEPYYAYFGSAAGPAGLGYYSYDIGTWHVIVLNSNCTAVSCAAGSAQVKWLQQDLTAHPAACTLAYYHHPRWSSGLHGSDANLQTIWGTLSDAGVDVGLSGHDHAYERFAQLDQTGQVAAHGLREFVVGTGGRSLYAFRTVAIGSEVRSNASYGVLRLQLHRDGYSWKFLSIDGQPVDEGFDRCH